MAAVSEAGLGAAVGAVTGSVVATVDAACALKVVVDKLIASRTVDMDLRACQLTKENF